jgi:hypothetical protein
MVGGEHIVTLYVWRWGVSGVFRGRRFMLGRFRPDLAYIKARRFLGVRVFLLRPLSELKR